MNRTWILATGVKRSVLVVLILLVLAGAILRICEVPVRSMSHPEIYVPRIDLPPDISRPPPRHTLAEVWTFHFYTEVHPPGYFLFMWVWVNVFGTGVWSLRLPSVLFGVASIIFLFLIVSRVYGTTAGLLAAGMLTFNGHHIYWSQMARMYSMVCLLGLVSVWMLLDLGSRSTRSVFRETLYGVVCWFGVFTEIMFWPLLAAQIVWTILRTESAKPLPRMIVVQLLIVILGAPLCAHAVQVAHESFLEGPSISFLVQFISFGFLYLPDTWSIPARGIPFALYVGVALIAVALLWLSLKTRPAGVAFVGGSSSSWRQLLPSAIGSILLICFLASLAHRRRQMMLMTALIPILCLIAPSVIRRSLAVVRKLQTSAKWMMRFPGGSSPFIALAFLPVFLTLLISIFVPLMERRTFLIYVPYILALLSAGAVSLFRSSVWMAAIIAVLIAIHAGSVAFFHFFPSDTRNYKGLALQILPELREDDLLFVYRKNWVTTPIFYYIDWKKNHFVADGYLAAVRRTEAKRAWVLLLGPQGETVPMRSALKGFRLQREFSALRARALLYVRAPATQ